MKKQGPRLKVDREYMKKLLKNSDYTIKSIAKETGVSTNTVSSFLNGKIHVFKAERLGEFLLLTGGNLDDIAYYVDKNDVRMSRNELLAYMKKEGIKK